MPYYVISPKTGDVISACEEVMRSKDGSMIMGTLVPEGGQSIPFRTLFRAVQGIRNRERGRYGCPVTWHIRKGAFHGYYFVATHEQHPLRSSHPDESYNVTYLILPVEEWPDEPWYMGENARCLKESCG